MQHKWDEGDTLLSLIVSFCEVCGGVRVRKRVAGVDYFGGNTVAVDAVGDVDDAAWDYQGTPSECPGRMEESE